MTRQREKEIERETEKSLSYLLKPRRFLSFRRGFKFMKSFFSLSFLIIRSLNSIWSFCFRNFREKNEIKMKTANFWHSSFAASEKDFRLKSERRRSLCETSEKQTRRKKDFSINFCFSFLFSRRHRREIIHAI